MNLQEMTVEEAEKVTGGVGPAGAAVGGVLGGISYWKGSSNPNVRGLTVAVIGGALGGFVGGLVIGPAFGTVSGLYANEVK